MTEKKLALPSVEISDPNYLFQTLLWTAFIASFVLAVGITWLQYSMRMKRNQALYTLFVKQFGDCKRFEDKGNGEYLVYTGISIYQVTVKRKEVVRHQKLAEV